MSLSGQSQGDPEACGLNNRGNPPGRRESTAGFGTALSVSPVTLPTEPVGDERSVGGVAGERSSRSGAGTRAKHGAAPHDVLSAVPNPADPRAWLPASLILILRT